MRGAAKDVVQPRLGRKEIETQGRISPRILPDRRDTLLQSERRKQAPRDGDDSRAFLPTHIRNRMPRTFTGDMDRHVLAAREQLWMLASQGERARDDPQLEPTVVWRSQQGV